MAQRVSGDTCRRLATAKWIVQAQQLSRQDDQYGQSKLFNKPLTTGSEPGTVVSLDESFGRSNNRVRCTRVFKGGLAPKHDERYIRVSRLRGCIPLRARTSRTEADDGFEVENDEFLLV